MATINRSGGYFPSYAKMREGFDDRTEKRNKTRADNLKAMQEMADIAAAEGKTLTLDQWQKMMNEQVGALGFLQGSNPSQTLSKNMLETSNKKAESARQQKAHDDFIARAERDDIALKDYKARIASNPDASAEDLREEMEEVYGAEAAKRLQGQFGSVQRDIHRTERQNAIADADLYETVEQAKEAMKGMTDAGSVYKTNLIDAVKKKEVEKEKTRIADLDKFAATFTPGSYDSDKAAEMRQLVQDKLLQGGHAQGRSAEEVNADVDRIIRIWKDSAIVRMEGASTAIGETAAKANAEYAPQLSKQQAEMVENADRAAREADDKREAEIIARATARAAGVSTKYPAPEKGKPGKPLRQAIINDLTNYNFSEQVSRELDAAYNADDSDEYQRIRAKALKDPRVTTAASQLDIDMQMGRVLSSTYQSQGYLGDLRKLNDIRMSAQGNDVLGMTANLWNESISSRDVERAKRLATDAATRIVKNANDLSAGLASTRRYTITGEQSEQARSEIIEQQIAAFLGGVKASDEDKASLRDAMYGVINKTAWKGTALQRMYTPAEVLAQNVGRGLNPYAQNFLQESKQGVGMGGAAAPVAYGDGGSFAPPGAMPSVAPGRGAPERGEGVVQSATDDLADRIGFYENELEKRKANGQTGQGQLMGGGQGSPKP